MSKHSSALAAILRVSGALFLLSITDTAQGATLTVCTAGCNFTTVQAALNGAANGDTILVRAGQTFTESVVVPAKTCGSGQTYVTVRSDAADTNLPGPDRRFDPALHGSFVPIIQSGQTNIPALSFAANADCYRFMFLKFQQGPIPPYHIVQVGSPAETIGANQPDRIEFDRIWVSGDPQNGAWNGIVLHGQQVAILNSYIEEIKMVGVETHGIGGYNGPGPFTVTNNYIEAASINFMLGGADPAVTNPLNMTPVLARFDKNFVTKNLAWRNETWNVKNLFELKHAQGPAGADAVIEGNIFENNWNSGQTGYPVVFKSVNQDGNCGWCVVQRIDFRYNIIRSAPGAFLLNGQEGPQPATILNNLKIRHNLTYDISTAYGAGLYWAQLSNGSTNVTIDHNTTDHVMGNGTLILGGTPDATGLVVTNNLFRRLTYGVKGDNTGEGTSALDTYAPGWVVRRNTVSGASPSGYPADNFFPNETDFQNAFTNYAGRDYRLAPGHTYWDDATDGTFLGADITRINELTAIAASGNNSAAPSEVVIYASDIPPSGRHGSWATASDPTSPNTVKLVTPDFGLSQLDAPLATPTDYIDVTFTANASTSYTLWLRLQATADSKWNDAVWVQYSDAQSGGSSVFPLNTTSGLLVNLATSAEATSLNKWGWVNTAYWLSQATTVTFATTGSHTLRIQIREDGVQLDQIVLSPSHYLTSPPGGPTNDTTVVPKP